ncbi:unnamed protein product [Microthlaspi erraticum]|uniref:Uncharacterized protein n=1 Tax=Microthlaspi erraticum TaxID=1685480 RepID=A0A6D2JE24_9BRAS|nr:unnamed protein product [Microthlaspi erraticum]CAA7035619.1 unnamed protein product [Microthlaspi erraticum]CAA7040274.1 unnamed protein product [Microthlaspi erraticum]CAA7057388.1 unnamed protein product [Microthlaspi erraticum]
MAETRPTAAAAKKRCQKKYGPHERSKITSDEIKDLKALYGVKITTPRKHESAASLRVMFWIDEFHQLCSMKGNNRFPGSFYSSPGHNRTIDKASVGDFDFDRIPKA